MKGLQESGRIEQASNDQSINIENSQASLENIENTLKRYYESFYIRLFLLKKTFAKNYLRKSMS